MIQAKEISKKALANKVSDRQIEKDYVLTWILNSITAHSKLKTVLVFKGGTVLKKCYFKDYRYSEDLDFTLLDEQFAHEELKQLLVELFDWLKQETNITIQHKQDDTHSASGSSLFYVDFIGPLGGNMGSRDLKIDITRGEKIQFELVHRELLSEYSDKTETPFLIQCYPLGEVLIEKMSALMGRTEARDLYDFWYLMEVERLDFDEHVIEYCEKAKFKGHTPKYFSAIVQKKEAIFKRDWETKLDHQINDLPKFEDVMREVKRHLKVVDKLLSPLDLL